MQVPSLGWEDPLKKEMAPTLVFFPGKFRGQRRLAGYSPRGHKESDMTERLSTQEEKRRVIRGRTWPLPGKNQLESTGDNSVN